MTSEAILSDINVYPVKGCQEKEYFEVVPDIQ